MTPLSQDIVDAYAARVPGVRFDESMTKHTTFRLGGAVRLYVVASSSDMLLRAVEVAIELKIPWYVIGGGTNMLVADTGFEGVVIQAANQGMVIEDDRVTVESGMVSALVARKTVEAGLTGFEWAVGLPGTIGGAVYGNAGCFGGDMRDSVALVDVYDVEGQKRYQLTNDESQFCYRESRFKHERFVILGCTLQLRRAENPEEAKAKIEAILRDRKEKQPLGESSAGCVFKNFEYQDEGVLSALLRDVQVPAQMLSAKRIPAGWLIDQAGLKGQSVGGFEVSERHGNFFLNKQQGKAEDVLALISLVKMKVRDMYGIQLHEEVQLLGFC